MTGKEQRNKEDKAVEHFFEYEGIRCSCSEGVKRGSEFLHIGRIEVHMQKDVWIEAVYGKKGISNLGLDSKNKVKGVSFGVSSFYHESILQKTK